jgi:hypothetical protein
MHSHLSGRHAGRPLPEARFGGQAVQATDCITCAGPSRADLKACWGLASGRVDARASRPVQQRGMATYARCGCHGQASTYALGCTLRPHRGQGRADSLHPGGLADCPRGEPCPLRARSEEGVGEGQDGRPRTSVLASELQRDRSQACPRRSPKQTLTTAAHERLSDQ